jgi:hypothetical protein
VPAQEQFAQYWRDFDALDRFARDKDLPLLNRRQARQRGHAVAAQAAIVAAQAARSAKAVSAAIDGSGDRGAASNGLRTYMMMLLTGAPVLIADPVARRFLEQA